MNNLDVMLKSTWERNSDAVRKSTWRILYHGPIFDPKDYEKKMENPLGARLVHLNRDPILKIYHLEKCTINYERNQGTTMIEGFGTEEDLGEVVKKLRNTFPKYEFESL